MSTRKEKKKNRLLIIAICPFIFGFGFYLLEEVSTWFEVPLGNTFYVIIGSTLMAASGVYVIYTVKELYFKKYKKSSDPTNPRRKRRSSRTK